METSRTKPTPDGNGARQELRTAAGNNPVAYAEHADQFIGLKPIYVRSVLNALLSEASNQGDFDRTKVLDLVAFSYCQSGHKIASAALSEGDDTDWTWACMAAGQLLAAGLRRGSEGIPFEHAPLVQSLVLKALMLAPVRSELEDFEDRFQRSPYIAAQMTLRGLGIELCILLTFW